MRLLNRLTYRTGASVLIPDDVNLVFGCITARVISEYGHKYKIEGFIEGINFARTYYEDEVYIIDPVKIFELEEGDLVYLSDPDPEYQIYEANPALATPGECRGMVIEVDPDGDRVEVEWENGSYNDYKNYELCLAKNLEFKNGLCVSIWPI